MLQAIGILAVTSVGWAAAGLYIGAAPWFRAYGTQKCCRVKGACTHLEIERLQHSAALLLPVILNRENKTLEC